MRFDDQMAAPLGRIEARLEAALDALDVAPSLVEAMRYSALSGGKRLRPLLAWHWCQETCGEGDRALDAGVAIELIHAFSLVHDDLPAMDDDDLRRGRPTLHVHAGEAMAILAGDAMLAHALTLLTMSYDATTASRLVLELGTATSRMISGQVYDTLGFGDAAIGDDLKLEAIHGSKTGALIRAACRIGAICGGRTDLSDVDAYGDAIGLMFQVVDDLLDIEQSDAETGKRTGKDANAGKLTWPGVHGAASSRRTIESLRDRANAIVTPDSALSGLASALAIRTR